MQSHVTLRHDLIGRGQCTEPSSQRPLTFNNLCWSKVKCSSVSRASSVSASCRELL